MYTFICDICQMKHHLGTFFEGFMIILFCLVGVRDISSWSDRMREPFIKLYGEEYFKQQWGSWIDAISRYYKERKGKTSIQYPIPTHIHNEKG